MASAVLASDVVNDFVYILKELNIKYILENYWQYRTQVKVFEPDNYTLHDYFSVSVDVNNVVIEIQACNYTFYRSVVMRQKTIFDSCELSDYLFKQGNRS